jgi:hypothetical protein
MQGIRAVLMMEHAHRSNSSSFWSESAKRVPQRRARQAPFRRIASMRGILSTGWGLHQRTRKVGAYLVVFGRAPWWLVAELGERETVCPKNFIGQYHERECTMHLNRTAWDMFCLQ